MVSSKPATVVRSLHLATLIISRYRRSRYAVYTNPQHACFRPAALRAIFRGMNNPWLDIPLSDYEGHMALPEVAQAQLLADLFAEALRTHMPQSVAVLGCAGGNGFERVNTSRTPRVVGVDLNPAYIDVARERFAQRIPRFELYVGDVQRDVFGFAPVELAFAGLLFEYVDVAATLQRIRAMVVPGGSLVAVLQLPSTIDEVTPSPFESLTTLTACMRLVAPETLAKQAATHSFCQTASDVAQAVGGKSFGVVTLRREMPDPHT